MAYTCSKCGWKHKPSHERYYQSRGLSQPNCVECNPSSSQQMRKRYVAFVVGSFSNTYMGYVPLASIPYIPVIMLLSVVAAIISPQKLSVPLSFLCFIAGYIAIGYSARKAGKRISLRLAQGQSVVKIVLGYYVPLCFTLIVCVALWWVKYYVLF